MFYPTIWDWSTFIGTIGLFLALMFLFLRFVPAISIFEMRELVSETEGQAAQDDGTTPRQPAGAAH
jgi:molybdopterin-containing oxidoreductase family membrane subunit